MQHSRCKSGDAQMVILCHMNALERERKKEWTEMVTEMGDRNVELDRSEFKEEQVSSDQPDWN